MATEIKSAEPAVALRRSIRCRWSWWSSLRVPSGWPVRAGIVLLVVLYLALWGASGLLDLNPTDFDVFFLPSAHIALSGHPFEIYRVRYQAIYPNANGPLSILPLTLVAGVAAHFGWLNDVHLRRMLAMGAFAVFSLLMGREAMLAVDRLLDVPLGGVRRLLAYALFTLSPQLWHSVLFYGHLELPIMLWLALAAVRSLAQGRAGRAGALLGLALLTRSAAVLYVLPLLLLLLRHGRWRASAWLVGAVGAVVGLGLLPFWLVDRSDLMYSLVTFRRALPVGGGSLWGVAPGTWLAAFGRDYDSAVVLVAVLLICVATLALRRDLDVMSRDVYALLALASLCFPLFIKTLWPYYFLEPYILLALWWLAGAAHARQPKQRVLWWLGLGLPIAMIGCAQLSEQGLSVLSYGNWLPLWSLWMFGTMLAITLVLALAVWLGEHRRHMLALWLFAV